MSRGYPSYYGQASFNKSGAWNIIKGAFTVLSGSIVNIFAIYGQGSIYGGFIWEQIGPNWANFDIDLIVDGNDQGWYPVNDLPNFGIGSLGTGCVFIANSPAVNAAINFGIKGGLTFTNSILFDMRNRDGATSITGLYEVDFAIIT